MAENFAKTLLVIDDDKLFCHAVVAFFKKSDLRVITVNTGQEGLQWFKQNRAEVVLLDQNLPDREGLSLCTPLIEFSEQTKIIFITAYPSFDHAVQALRKGAHDYLSKPMELEQLDLAVQRAFRTVELERLEQVKIFHDHRKLARNRPVGMDGGLRSIKQLIYLAASTRVPVLITGETGTGKNVVAKAIHYQQDDLGRTFVGTNCAALPENLIESELFGYEKGAYTGAGAARKGLFEMADGGTLFLDEIGDIPLHLQSKLLAVLDDGTMKRLGGEMTRQVDVRIIAATNVDLEQAITGKAFREDLYYRLSVLRIHLPPLRERKEDIEPLCLHFIRNRIPDQHLQIPAEELGKLREYDWPGNVRELKNIIERAIILRSGSNIHPSQFLGGRPKKALPVEVSCLEHASDTSIEPLLEVERRHICRVLSLCDHNHSRAAKALGIARSTLIRKIEQHRLKSGDSN
jgi:DNA-binding NtrC family response regulator